MQKQLLLCLLLLPLFGWAQNGTETQLKNLAPPSSPAFMLMDISPSAIYIPENLKAVSLQVLNGLGGDSQDGIPKNFAAEIVPFWYTTPKNMNYLKYNNLRKSNSEATGVEAYDSQNIFGDLFKKASISLAYMDNTFEVFETPQNFISIGARTTLIRVIRKQDITEFVSKYKNYETVKNSITGDVNYKLGDLAKSKPFLKADEDLRNVANIRPVFIVDIATAYSMLLKNNETDFSDTFGRFGAWISTDLALGFNNNPNNYIHVYGVARYIKDGLNLDANNLLFDTESYDIGGKLEVELDKLSLGYEYLSREGDTDEYRSIGTIRYKVSGAITLTGGFGKNFKSGDDTVSLIGIKWGINSGEGLLSILKN